MKLLAIKNFVKVNGRAPRKVHHVMTKHLLLILVWAVSSAVASTALAQQDTGMQEIESMFSNEENSSDVSQPEPEPSSIRQKPAEGPAEGKPADVKEVSDLERLQSFNDIAVISRRFLPKSQRFEAFVGGALNLNDAFFYNFGLQGRLGYYFSERYGVEATATFLTSSEREVTSTLKEKRGVRTEAYVTPSSFYVLDFKWSPIYGKMSWRNQKITPFDHYFTFGLGMTSTNQGGSGNLTYHLGTGQIYAFSKSGGLRWDFSWYSFQAKVNVAGVQSVSNYNNLVFTIGWSWFFPEATYR